MANKRNSKRRKTNDKSDHVAEKEPREQEERTSANHEQIPKEKPTHDDNDDDNDVVEPSDQEQGHEKAAAQSSDQHDEDEDGDGKSNEADREDAVDSTSMSQSKIASDGRYRNKQRCLTVCTRGVTARYRHLLEDLRTLLPHHKKESKLDPGSDGMARAVHDIAEIRGCNSLLFLECRKRLDAYMWIGKVGGTTSVGPSIKFHVTNIHTMDELRLTGNCMKGSRPLLTFGESFGRLPHLKLVKELFVDVFGTPRGHPKSKPFVDRIMAFYYADKRIWVRNYQILEQKPTNALELHQLKKKSGPAEATSLVEIGPRFVLNPIRIFRGSFGGQTLYQNPEYVSPNVARAMLKRKKGESYEQRKESEQWSKERRSQIVVPEDPLAGVFREE